MEKILEEVMQYLDEENTVSEIYRELSFLRDIQKKYFPSSPSIIAAISKLNSVTITSNKYTLGVRFCNDHKLFGKGEKKVRCVD
jgi:hypothetical protein